MELLLKFELLLSFVEQLGKTLRKQHSFCSAPRRMCVERASQASHICLYFNNLLCFGKSDKASEALAKQMPLSCCCIFAKSGSDQVLNDIIGIKLLFHGLALTRGGENFLRCKYAEFAVGNG